MKTNSSLPIASKRFLLGRQNAAANIVASRNFLDNLKKICYNLQKNKKRLKNIMKNIIIVDMQKGFINQNNCHLPDKINNYLKQNTFDNIFFTKCINTPKSPYVKILNWNGMIQPEQQELVVFVPNNAKILTNNGYGLCEENIKMFKQLKIEEMEICGTDTDACCLAIAFNLFDNGIKPIILSDLCASSSKNADIHFNALEIMKRQFGHNNVK